MVKLIWMSDLHYQADGDVLGEDPRARLDAALGMIAAHHGDAELVVLTGDLANHGGPEHYAALAARLATLPMPVLPLVGNHDDRAALAAHLPWPAGLEGFAQYAVDLGDARLVCLDSLIPGETAGALCPARLDWLRAELADRPERPRYVFMHHPPGALGLPAQDPDNLRDPGPFLGLLRAAPGVAGVFAGHVHRPCQARLGGVPVTTIRSLTLQAPPPWPAWDWDSFAPAPEVPQFGVLWIDGPEYRLQFLDVPG